jgi:hypothetical protein
MAEQEDDALTLEGLAQKLNTQTLRLEALERENAELRSKVATLQGSDTGRAVEETASSFEKRRVSRSWLLRNAGAAAVGTMAAGALLARDASVAKANHFAQGIRVNFVVTHLETANSTAVLGNAPNGEGVVGFGKTHGVRGEGQTGVFGISSGTGRAGVSGKNVSEGGGYGVVGDGTGGFEGVLGRSSRGGGVRGEGHFGVSGRATRDGGTGVYGATGPTVRGDGVVGSGSGLEFAGVFGSNETGTGVEGRGTVLGVNGFSNAGAGVFGESQQGYAGAFQGGKAQLRIVPKSGTGPPTSGSFGAGDLYLDSAAALFVCVAGGTPGTWRRFQTVAA